MSDDLAVSTFAERVAGAEVVEARQGAAPAKIKRER
jgi:hypothetical protein